MKWTRTSGAGDMVDARSARRPGGRRAATGAGGLSLTAVVVVLLLQLLSGGKFDVPQAAFDEAAQANVGQIEYPLGPTETAPTAEDELAEFTKAVGVEIQDLWTQLFADAGLQYTRAQIVRYSQAVETACGNATSAAGPFYCPLDQRVYLDMSFYTDMQEMLGANGDFAWAYIVAHEIGHHVQNLTGVFAGVDELRAQDPSSDAGIQGLSVRTELQADCYAGVWGHAAFRKGQLEPGDLDEALAAAEAVGDDRIQARATGSIQPDLFTHGSSLQRRNWFVTGYNSGAPGDCDTFTPGEV